MIIRYIEKFILNDLDEKMVFIAGPLSFIPADFLFQTSKNWMASGWVFFEIFLK